MCVCGSFSGVRVRAESWGWEESRRGRKWEWGGGDGITEKVRNVEGSDEKTEKKKIRRMGRDTARVSEIEMGRKIECGKKVERKRRQEQRCDRPVKSTVYMLASLGRITEINTRKTGSKRGERERERERDEREEREREKMREETERERERERGERGSKKRQAHKFITKGLKKEATQV